MFRRVRRIKLAPRDFYLTVRTSTVTAIPMAARSLPVQHRKVSHDNVPPHAFQFFIIYSRVLGFPEPLLELQIRILIFY